ncbi:Enhancer of polycomb-like protein 1 [Podochytrium sp. JEL0797]|nr:Enhancer of polycomb-like protein 1 [Podochytrium sp. JEL0797]
MALRSRKVDFKRKFAVFRFSECEDLDENVSLAKTVKNIKTGVDKEEEDEHHLRAALDANHAGTSNKSVNIPVPDASQKFTDYDRYYTHDYVIPKHYVKFSAQMDDYVGSSYCLDLVDDAFLEEWKREVDAKAAKQGQVGQGEVDAMVVDEGEAEVVLNEDQFEECMSVLERFGNERLGIGSNPTEQESISWILLNEPTLALPALSFSKVFSHWSHRRYDTPRFQTTNMNPGRPIHPPLRVDELSHNPKQDDADPYICFRKRDLRPNRKHTKRVDNASLDKLKKLHADLLAVRDLLDHVGAREETRRELLAMDTAFFEKRCLVRRLKRAFGVVEGSGGSVADENKKRKRREETRPSAIKIKLRNPSMENMLELKSPGEGPVSEDTKILEQIKKRRIEDETAGYVDLTEFLRPPSSILFSISCDSHQTHLHFQSSFITSTNDNTVRAAKDWTRPGDDVRRKLGLEEWDEEVGGVAVEMEDTIHNMAFRSFHLSPNSDDINHLLTKPTYPDQLNPKPCAPFDASVPRPPPLIQYEIVRAGMGGAVVPVLPGGDPATPAAAAAAPKKKASATKPPKKPLPVLSEKEQRLRNMLEESKKEAVQNQQKAAAAAAALAAGEPVPGGSQSPAVGPAALVPSAGGGIPPNASPAAQMAYLQHQQQQMIAAASRQQQQQQPIPSQAQIVMMMRQLQQTMQSQPQPMSPQMQQHFVNQQHRLRVALVASQGAAAAGGGVAAAPAPAAVGSAAGNASAQQQLAAAAAGMVIPTPNGNGTYSFPNGTTVTQHQLQQFNYNMLMRQKLQQHQQQQVTQQQFMQLQMQQIQAQAQLQQQMQVQQQQQQQVKGEGGGAGVGGGGGEGGMLGALNG